MNDINSVIAELSTLLSKFGAALVDLSPRLVGALLFLIFGLIVTRLASAGTRRLLRSLDAVLLRRWRQRVGTESHLSATTIGISVAIVRWTLVFIVLAGVTQILGIEALSRWFAAAIDQLPALIAGGIIIFVGIVASQFARDLVVAFFLPISGAQAKAFGLLTQVMIIVTALVMGLGQAGIDTTLLVSIVIILLASLFGGMALAFGIGARDLVANIIGSHHAQKLVNAGQTVRVGATQGQVVRMTATATVLDTSDGQTVVPGALFQREQVTVVQAEEVADE